MNLRSIVTAIFLASFASSAFAADIGYVNVQEIMHDSTAAKSVQEQIESKQKAFRTEMSKKEEDLQKEEQALAKQRSVLSPEAFEKKVKEFKEKAGKAQKEVKVKGIELENAFSTSLAEIQKSVTEIVAKIAKEKNYVAVFPASQLLYADPKLDITKEFLSKLNTALPKVTVNFKSTAKTGDE